MRNLFSSFSSVLEWMAARRPRSAAAYITLRARYIGCEHEHGRCGGPVMDGRGLDGVGARLID